MRPLSRRSTRQQHRGDHATRRPTTSRSTLRLDSLPAGDFRHPPPIRQSDPVDAGGTAMPLSFELAVNETTDPSQRYLTWTPYSAQVRLTDADGAPGPVQIGLRNADGNVGRLRFRSDAA